MKAPFQKPFESKDNYPEGRNTGSYQYGTEYVHIFNRNSAERSPTTSSKECKKRNNNTFLPKPKK